ncbi:MAG: CaiB/BaiF CoA-transferase family protein [Anaerolineae bacterium]|nr:CaiB/BaiF CoA-transferase family protein [Anaerolineae bacterium]
MPKPLENIRVLDLTRVLVGPYCTMLLGDLGAEIIKVERPPLGDDSRMYGPFIEDCSLYFISINRGKKSITLNLKDPRGKQILLELVKKVDVVVENFRPGTMEKLGIGYDVLKDVNPQLIYAAASGFGHTGPDAQKPAYDILAQAMGGLMSITGWPDSPPTRVGISIGDITAALFTTIGISTALYQRAITGSGQKVDVAMLDCQVAVLENALVRYQATGQNPHPLGNRHPTVSPFQAYLAADDYFVVGIGNDALFDIFCTTIGRPDLPEDPRFITNQLRTANLPALNEILEPELAKKPAQEWLERFEANAVPCAPINKISDVMHHPQVQARKMIIEVEDNVAGTVKLAGNPIKMSSLTEESTRQPAPHIGEHNDEIYRSVLGLSESALETLKRDQVI